MMASIVVHARPVQFVYVYNTFCCRCQAGIVVPWFISQLAMLASHIVVPFQVTVAPLLILLPTNVPGGAAADGPSTWALLFMLETQKSGSWLGPGPALIVAAIWRGTNEWMEGLSLSLCPWPLPACYFCHLPFINLSLF